jgi:hypothetical protein
MMASLQSITALTLSPEIKKDKLAENFLKKVNMKNLHWPAIAFLIVALHQLTSSTKTANQGSDNCAKLGISSNVASLTASEFANCKLRRIYQVDFNGFVTALFTYNKAGNP